MLPVAENAPAEGAPSHPWKKPAAIGGSAAVVLSLVLAAIPGGDVDEGGRRSDPSPMPSSRNGFDYVAFRTGEIHWPTDPQQRHSLLEIARGRAFDGDFAQSVLTDNWQILARFEASLAAPLFRLPQVRSAAPFGPHVEWQKYLGKLQSVQAFVLAKSGLHDDSINAAIKLIRLGKRIETGKGGLVDWLTGNSLKEQGVACLHRLIAKPQIPARKLVHLIDRLGAFRCDRAGLEYAYDLEERLTLRRLEDLASGRADPSAQYLAEAAELSVDWRHTRLQAEATARALQQGFAVARKAARAYGPTDWAALEAELAKPLTRLRSTTSDHNAIGIRMCEEILGGALLTPLRERNRIDTALDALRTVIALKAYALRESRFPDTLEQLAPFFAGRQPGEGITGDPLRYDPERKIVYSIGNDGRDDGGSRAEDPDRARNDRAEPTFWIEF